MSSGMWRGPGCRTFEADPACGRAVRHWIARIIGAHSCPVDPQDAALVVSELFGNAVMHGPAGGAVLVAYLLWPGGARIVVCDSGGPTLPRLRDHDGLPEGGGLPAGGGLPEGGGPPEGGRTTPPRPRDRDGLAEGGRGLLVVDALAARWGSFRTAPAQVVWCDLGQPLPAATAEAWAWLNAVLAGSALGTRPGMPRAAEPGCARRASPRSSGTVLASGGPCARSHGSPFHG